MATHVLIFGRLHHLEDQQAFEAAFEHVSRVVLSSVQGILRDELIHDSNDPHAYIMRSEWADQAAWASWQRAPIHEEQVGLLQNYWQGQGVKIFTTVYSIEKADAEKQQVRSV